MRVANLRFHETSGAKRDQIQARKHKKTAVKKRTSGNDPDKWLTFVEEPIRSQVIRKYILEAENDYVQRFRQQEVCFALKRCLWIVGECL